MKYLKTYENFNINVEINIDSKECEYQYRDIDVGAWYKRVKGTDMWSFTTEEDFNKNATKDNTIEWKK